MYNVPPKSGVKSLPLWEAFDDGSSVLTLIEESLNQKQSSYDLLKTKLNELTIAANLPTNNNLINLVVSEYMRGLHSFDEATKIFYDYLKTEQQINFQQTELKEFQEFTTIPFSSEFNAVEEEPIMIQPDNDHPINFVTKDYFPYLWK